MYGNNCEYNENAVTGRWKQEILRLRGGAQYNSLLYINHHVAKRYSLGLGQTLWNDSGNWKLGVKFGTWNVTDWSSSLKTVAEQIEE
jgi:hypothetical protein